MNPVPVSHPACWHARDLFHAQDWKWEFDPTERGELASLVRESQSTSWPEVESRRPLDASTPALLEKMIAIRDALEHGSGAVLLRGFPLPDDDLDSPFPDDSLLPYAESYWRLLSTVGTPVPQTADGAKLFRVQDEGLKDDDPKARGPSSRKRLSFHTDRCDVIGFMCVRQAQSGGDNQIVSSMAVYNRILERRPDLLRRLCQPVCYRRHNVDPGNQNTFYRQPVFSSCNGHFACTFLRVLIERAYADDGAGSMPNDLREALDFLEQTAEDPDLCVQFRQRPGDIVLLNNFVTLHRRTEFVDDPIRKRLLLRLWLAVPNSRPLDASFAASYGATQAGAVRGGMRPMSSSDI